MFSFLGSDRGKAPLKAGSHNTNLLFPRSLCNHLPYALVFFGWWTYLLQPNQPVREGIALAKELQQHRGYSQQQGSKVKESFKCLTPCKVPQSKPKSQDLALKKQVYVWASHLVYHPPAAPPLGLWEAAPRHQQLLFFQTFAGQVSYSGNLQGIEEGTFVNRQPCYVDLINMCSANSKQIPALPQAEFLQTLPSKTLCHSCGEA